MKKAVFILAALVMLLTIKLSATPEKHLCYAICPAAFKGCAVIQQENSYCCYAVEACAVGATAIFETVGWLVQSTMDATLKPVVDTVCRFTCVGIGKNQSVITSAITQINTDKPPNTSSDEEA